MSLPEDLATPRRLLLFATTGALVIAVLWWWTAKELDIVAPAAKTMEQAAPTVDDEPSSSEPPRAAPSSKTTAATALSRSPSMAAWERQIDQVLDTQAPPGSIARILISMIPSLPEEGQEAAAQHISNLLSDQEYPAVLPLLINPSTSEPVLSVLATDLMNRDDQTKLHAWVEIAKVPNHPYHEEALGNLEIYLDNDYGADWAKWNGAVDEYLSNAQRVDYPEVQ